MKSSKRSGTGRCDYECLVGEKNQVVGFGFRDQTPRLELRSILDRTDELKPLWLEFCQDTSLYPYFSVSAAETTPEQFTSGWFSLFARRHYNEQGCYNAIYEKGTGDFVGFTGIVLHDIEQEDSNEGDNNNINNNNKTEQENTTTISDNNNDNNINNATSNNTHNKTKQYIEISYSLLPQKRGLGYAQEITQYLRNYVFSHPDIFYLAEKYDNTIISIIHPDNKPSARVAEKNGMTIMKKFKFHGNDFYMYHITTDQWFNLQNQGSRV